MRVDIMLRRLFGWSAMSLAALGAVGCGDLLSKGPVAKAITTDDGSKTDIGSPLYEPKEWPTVKTQATPSDPIVIANSQLTISTKQDAFSHNDGTLYFIGTEIKPGETVLPERVIVSPFDSKQQFKLLREGDRVERGDLLAWVDDRRARAAVASRAAGVVAAKKEREAATKVVAATKTNLDMTEAAFKKGAASELELLKARVEYDRAMADEKVKEANITKAEAELSEAQVLLSLHEIRASVSGTVGKVYRHQGEAVKANEQPIVLVQGLGKLKVEGVLDAQYANRLQLGQSVMIEPTLQDAPQKVLVGHMQTITAIAVTKDPKNPLIVSASEDRTVRIWDRTTQLRILPHNTAVRAVATTFVDGKNWCLTGSDDGIVRLWDLSEAESKPKELKGHTGVIHVVEFSPDGSTCATADERELRLWDVAKGELKYKFPPAQRGQITSIQFLPQTKLLTVGRDNTLRLWALGQKGAKLETTVDRRSGDVGLLNVSLDGRKLLYDQGRSLHVLGLPDQRTLNVLQNPSEAGKFSTFALFSPDGRLVLTAGHSEGRLQLFRLNEDSLRATELRQFSADRSSQSTCAAFAPDGSFAVTGSQDRKVYVWTIPPKTEIDRQWPATIANIEANIDSTRQIRVTADYINSKDRPELLPGTTVTIVVPSK
jgi:WD40 repeat protein